MKSLLSEDGSINVDLLTKEVAVLSMPVLFGKGFEFVQQLASKLKKTNKQVSVSSKVDEDHYNQRVFGYQSHSEDRGPVQERESTSERLFGGAPGQDLLTVEVRERRTQLPLRAG